MTTVTLFSVPGCDACGPVRALLDRLAGEFPGLAVEEVDVTEHPEAATRHRLLACPAVAVDGQVRFVGGVDERRLRIALGVAGVRAGTTGTVGGRR